MKSKEKKSYIAMFLLALYPILSGYMSPIAGFTWADLSLWGGLLVILSYRTQATSFLFPSHYLAFWGYVAFATIVTASPFRASFLIPGGVAFFSWSVFLGYMLSNHDIVLFKKFLRFFFYITAAIFIGQELWFFITGSRFPALLPISETVYGGLPLETLRAIQMHAHRSCSVFMEPAYFAEFCLCLLCLELFDEDGMRVLFNKQSYAIFVILLFLRSGCGLVGMLILATLKVKYYAGRSLNKLLTILVVVLPIAIVVFYYYASSRMGAEVMARQTEFYDDSNSSAYIRVLRGFILYDGLPLVNKIIGISNEEMINSSIGTYLGIENNTMITNGIQTVLVRYGLLGLIIYLFLIFKMIKRNNPISHAAVFLFLVISTIESTFLSPIMLILFMIAYSYGKREISLKRNNNRIQISQIEVAK